MSAETEDRNVLGLTHMAIDFGSKDSQLHALLNTSV